MTVDEILGRLERVKRKGERAVARCPAHEDTNPSLSVSHGDGGKILLHCHAGCETTAILDRLGLTESDLFERSNGSGTHEDLVTYDYTDERGELLYQVVRGPRKTFRQRRPDGEGGWLWNLNGTRRVLYHLPFILEACEVGGPVYVVEGERDVHSVEGTKNWATTNSGGAGKWRSEYADALQGASVVIIADRDEPGIAHARQIAETLPTASTRIVQAAVGKDVTDHLAAGLTLEELVPLEPEPVAEAAEGPFSGLTNDQVLELDFPEERHLIRDLIPAGAVGTIAGVPETHKSWLAQAIGVRIASGTGTVLGCEVVGPGAVGYFWQDDSTREEAERIKLFHTVSESPPGLPIRWFLNEGLRLPADLERLRATIDELGLVLVVLDSFYNVLSTGIDLKDEGAEQVVALLKREIADATGCTVLIVDHMPWATDTNRQRLRAYGGVFKNAATRFGIYIDAAGKNLSIESRGNNIRGFKKRPAYWDEENLELHLVEAADHTEKVEERAAAVLKWLEDNPGTHSNNAIRKAVGGRANIVDEALTALQGRDAVRDALQPNGTHPDAPKRRKGWIASIHAGLLYNTPTSLFDGTHTDALTADPFTDYCVPVPIGDAVETGRTSDVAPGAEADRQTAASEDAVRASEPS